MLLLIIGGGLAGLAALHHPGVSAAQVVSTDAQQNITSDSYFYGDSPPVYPSPNMTGAATWATAFTKARAMVANMTMAEKINLTAGYTADNGCSGNIPPIPRLGFPGLCLSDAGNGLRATDYVSSWPSGIHVGATWNKDFAFQRGAGMGGEFKKKGVNVMLGPVIGPAGRVVVGGRNWEGFSIDPYLSGSLVYQTVSAVQGAGVITSTKHYIGNEQETNRNPEETVESVSSNIDDQTIHELYLWTFQDAVHAGSGNIMCSYNRINNSHACQNSKTLNGLLKTELGFQGFVVSDWFAQHSGVASALAGLDMAMPSDGGFWGANLTEAINNGSVPAYRLDDMVTRVIAAWYQMGQDQGFPAPGIGMPASLSAPHEVIDGRNASFRPVLLEGATEGHVLVKNANNTLPLKAPRLLSIFGYSAKAPDQNDYTSSGFSAWTFGDESANLTDALSGFSGSTSSHEAIAINGTLVSGGGSGATAQNMIVSPFDGIVQQAYSDGTALFWDFTLQDPTVNPTSDACIVIVNAFATEGFDRPGLHDDYTDGLIINVANQCKNTIVVFQNAGTRLVDQWIDHPNVTALIFAHLPGQDSGAALASILYGTANPSGKLPYTVAKNESDYGDELLASQPEGIYVNFPQSNFTEGVFVDYRHFDANNITPRYEFGFGLSYTTYSYSNLQIATVPGADTAAYPTGAVLEGGPADLWDVLVKVTADVANTGSMDGMEAAQLYLGIPGPGTPVRQLRGFEKPLIKAGQKATVEFDLTRRDLSVWDTVAQKWLLRNGTFDVSVGASSRILPLTGTFTIGGGCKSRRA